MRRNKLYILGGVMCVSASLYFFARFEYKCMFGVSGRLLGQWKCDNKMVVDGKEEGKFVL